jgi:hypothetical protein
MRATPSRPSKARAKGPHARPVPISDIQATCQRPDVQRACREGYLCTSRATRSAYYLYSPDIRHARPSNFQYLGRTTRRVVGDIRAREYSDPL